MGFWWSMGAVDKIHSPPLPGLVPRPAIPHVWTLQAGRPFLEHSTALESRAPARIWPLAGPYIWNHYRLPDPPRGPLRARSGLSSVGPSRELGILFRYLVLVSVAKAADTNRRRDASVFFNDVSRWKMEPGSVSRCLGRSCEMPRRAFRNKNYLGEIFC